MTQPTNSPDSESALDRHHLLNVRRTFLSLNYAKLILAKQNLGENQRIFLDVLPPLIHFNHPMLPGYLSKNTPSGLYNFNLTEEQMAQLKKITRSFRSNEKGHRTVDITALFSMGSLGTIAQNAKSDIDIWLCYRPDLDDNAISLLEKKCSLIESWAQTLQLDVTFFLMNSQAFRLSKKLEFNKEASGSTQHYLLLDEFYRTAIYLGGQLPAWIFISPEQESHYTETLKALIQKRLLPDKELIDFGHIDTIPTSEFISAAIWQLYKAIDSPYKSIMKLLILEIYCKDSSQFKLLSSSFKKELHLKKSNQVINVWETDPYIETYKMIEEHLLSTHQNSRLDFLRRCFYFKIENPLTTSSKAPKKFSTLFEMVKSWGWENDYIQHLDNHKNWPLKEMLEERRLIIAELNHSYHFVMDFFCSQETKIKASNRELNILGRKLHAAFSRKAGKIDWVNPIISQKITESRLTLEHLKKSKFWIAKNQYNETIVKKTTLIELITWLHCNRVIIQSTQITFNNIHIEERLFHSMRQLITSTLPLPIKTANHEVFERSCSLTKILFFIDYDIKKKGPHSQNIKDKKITELQCNIDQLSINSWNEIICESKQGILLDTILSTIISGLQKQGPTFNPDISYNHSNRAIQQKLKEQLDSLVRGLTLFFKRNQIGRYISYIENRYLLITIDKNKASLKWLPTEKSIKNVLSEIVPYPYPTGLDKSNMAQHPLAVFIDNGKNNSVQVFFRIRGKDTDIILIDEFGIWYECSINYQKDPRSLQAFHHFLRSTSARDLDLPKADLSPLDILPITFYEIFHSQNGWQANIQTVSSQVSGRNIAIHAIAEYNHGRYQFILHCEDCIFSEPTEGDIAYQKLRDFIQDQKTNNKIENFYIANLDLSRCQHRLSNSDKLHLSHYLKLKSLLENNIHSLALLM